MVVPHHRQHAAMGRGAVQVGVAYGVHGAVQPRALAVPQGEDAVVAAVAEALALLAAPDGGGGQVLVDSGLEVELEARQQRLGAPQLLVDVVHGRAAVARDVARRVEARRLVAEVLRHGEAHERLAPRYVGRTLGQPVAIVEGDFSELHGNAGLLYPRRS